jgi:hypothetical protein
LKTKCDNLFGTEGVVTMEDYKPHEYSTTDGTRGQRENQNVESFIPMCKQCFSVVIPNALAKVVFRSFVEMIPLERYQRMIVILMGALVPKYTY